MPVSAEKDRGLDGAARRRSRKLPARAAPHVHGEDEITDRDERFLAAEFVREKIFRLLGDEVPYATTVAIDQFEHEGALRRIHATVYVDRDEPAGDPARRGRRADEGDRDAGARTDMERLFGGKVFLEVWVRVKRGWADDDAQLARLGY